MLQTWHGVSHVVPHCCSVAPLHGRYFVATFTPLRPFASIACCTTPVCSASPMMLRGKPRRADPVAPAESVNAAATFSAWDVRRLQKEAPFSVRNTQVEGTSLVRECCVHDWRHHAVHMISVAQQTVLARQAAGVTALAEILFYRTEVRYEIFRIALLVAL